MFNKSHWIRICGWLINFLASETYLIFPLSSQMVYALHKGPYSESLWPYKYMTNNFLSTTISRGPKMKTVSYPHGVFLFLLPHYCTHIRLEYGLHTGTSNLQPSSLSLVFVCSAFFVNRGLELQPFWPAIKLTRYLKHTLLYNEFHWRKKWTWTLPDWFFSALGGYG